MAQQRKKYKPSEIIFKENDEGQEMFILISGAVELKKKAASGETLLKLVETPNDFFGEMAIVDRCPRSATAVAVEDTEVIVVDQPTFEHLILTNGKFALKIIKILSDRIRCSNLQISELVSEVPQERCVRGMVDFALKYGEQIFNGGYKINITEMSNWVNSHTGLSRKDIGNCVFKLLRAKEIDYAPTSAKKKEDIVLPEVFVGRYDRRN